MDGKSSFPIKVSITIDTIFNFDDDFDVMCEHTFTIDCIVFTALMSCPHSVHPSFIRSLCPSIIHPSVCLFAAFLTFVNCASVKAAARIENVFTVIKTFALVIIIITGLVVLAQGEFSTWIIFITRGAGTGWVLYRGYLYNSRCWHRVSSLPGLPL